MTDVFKKLNLKDQAEILVLNAPVSFEPELAGLAGVAVRRRGADVKESAFVLAFATRQKEIDGLARLVAGKVKGDGVVWCAYPKGSSKKYTCEFNRDTGFQPLGDAGFEPVRMVAIDEDWTAVRVRRVEFIKSLTRDHRVALSKAGKARTAKKR